MTHKEWLVVTAVNILKEVKHADIIISDVEEILRRGDIVVKVTVNFPFIKYVKNWEWASCWFDEDWNWEPAQSGYYDVEPTYKELSGDDKIVARIMTYIWLIYKDAKKGKIK